MTQLAADLKAHDSKTEWTKSSSLVCETWGIPATGNLVSGFLSSPISWEIIFKSNWPISPRGICPWLFGLLSSLLLVEAAILGRTITPKTGLSIKSLGEPVPPANQRHANREQCFSRATLTCVTSFLYSWHNISPNSILTRHSTKFQILHFFLGYPVDSLRACLRTFNCLCPPPGILSAGTIMYRLTWFEINC